jgi:tripartite-type tricarboxylate transporter receptor subunit TctC
MNEGDMTAHLFKTSLPRRAAMGAGLALATLTAWAQSGPGGYPDKPIRLVVPAASGSLTDPVARVVADEMKKRTGQAWTVDNKPGAGGVIGSGDVARAAPDGYTLLLSANNLLISPAMYRNVPYKVMEAFTPIGLVARADNLLVASSSTGWRSLADLVAAAKASPTGLDYTSPLIGSAAHLTVELFRTEAALRLNHIPYKDAGQGTSDTLAGRIPVNIMGKSTALPFIRKGELVALAFTGAARAPELPNVPTFAEAGYPKVHLGLWFGLLGPAGMPKAQVDYLSRELAAALKAPEVLKRLADLGVDPLDGQAKTMADTMQREEPIYRKVVNDAGIKVD